MSMIKGMVMGSCLALAAAGLGTANASAYSISGGAYTGVATTAHTFTFGGAYTMVCPAAGVTFSGTATGSASTNLTPHYTGCNFFGLPVGVTQSGNWSISVGSGPVSGVYTGSLHIPSTSTTTIEIPSTGCTLVVSGTQSFASSASTQNGSPTSLHVSINTTGIAYSASGCPFAGGTDGAYSSNGDVSVPGITVS